MNYIVSEASLPGSTIQKSITIIHETGGATTFPVDAENPVYAAWVEENGEPDLTITAPAIADAPVDAPEK